jgi:hypothetical protein
MGAGEICFVAVDKRVLSCNNASQWCDAESSLQLVAKRTTLAIPYKIAARRREKERDKLYGIRPKQE